MTEHVNRTHTIIAFEMITANAKEVEQVKSTNSKLTEENKQLQEDNKKITIENQRQARKLQEFEQRLKRLEKIFQQQDRRRPELVEADGYHEPVTSKSRYATSSKASFGDDSGYTSNSAMSVSKLRDDVDNQHSQLVQLGDNVQVMQENFTQFSIALDEIRLRQDVLEVKATNGVFIWKIPDIRRRYRDAVDRKTISLYSPPFYTSPHGYRMCIRVYLNGDGLGKGTHISVFFVLMKSEHDCLLSWPFKQSVRFTLINQVNQASSISEAFAPDLSSPSFQQPTGEMNVASGFPKFVRQSILQNEEFTQGNSIYIKAQVEVSGLAQL
jgi:regulator of replication initiation timing